MFYDQTGRVGHSGHVAQAPPEMVLCSEPGLTVGFSSAFGGSTAEGGDGGQPPVIFAGVARHAPASPYGSAQAPVAMTKRLQNAEKSKDARDNLDGVIDAVVLAAQ